MNLPDELVGKWIVDASGRLVGDDVEKQIWETIEHRLTRLADRQGGWTVLYVDASDQSYWELTFPQAEMHGGGHAKLTRLAAEEVPVLYPSARLISE